MIDIHCAGICCPNKRELEVDTPEGWFGNAEIALYCWDCQIEMKFWNAVCTGCAADRESCDLVRAYAYPSSKGLTPQQEQIIEQGRCPFRTNGTIFSNQAEGMRRIDISEIATPEVGKAVVEAIKRHWARHEKYRAHPKNLKE